MFLLNVLRWSSKDMHLSSQSEGWLPILTIIKGSNPVRGKKFILLVQSTVLGMYVVTLYIQCNVLAILG